jgi:putative pyruvate formate lyase activating enzyme
VGNDLLELFKNCRLCPRQCGVDRLAGEKGFCGLSARIRVAHYGPHFGEEPPVSGKKGSGNIFFASCNLRCIFCQNYQISRGEMGDPLTTDELVEIFFGLERRGCHNINLVSPTSYIPSIAGAIRRARKRGLSVPFVYNSNAYEEVEALAVLDGLIEIYLPDFKYWSDAVACRLSGVPVDRGYSRHAKAAILEMSRQVGPFTIHEGLGKKGLLLRHLVLPGTCAGSRHIMRWVRDNLGKGTFMSLMSQYNPLHEACLYPMINRRIRQEEYDGLIARALDLGLVNVFLQDLESAPAYVPDFRKAEPFEGGVAEELRYSRPREPARGFIRRGGRHGD